MLNLLQILFLNKSDLFEKRVPVSDIKNFFPVRKCLLIIWNSKLILMEFVHERITTVNQAIYEQVKIILEDGLQSSPKRQEELKKEKSIYSAFLTYSLLHCEAILLTCQCFLLQLYYCNGYSYAESGHGCCRRLAFFCSIHSSSLTSFSFPSLASLNTE